jgi:hypothetical protein
MIELSGLNGLFRWDKWRSIYVSQSGFGFYRETARPWTAEDDEIFRRAYLQRAWNVQARKAVEYIGPVTQSDIDALTALLDSMKGRSNG